MEDPKKKPGRQHPGAGGPQGIGVPAKGDSTPSQAPLDPSDGATISDVPLKPPTKPPTRPPAKTPASPVPHLASPDLTLAESLAGTRVPSGSFSGTQFPEIVLNPGDVIGGRYELLDMLGEGGMGAVFKAHDLEIDRFVALKVIRPELARNPAILARFKQELQTAHQVTHKNVIRIYDIAEADGVKFITMEFVDGADLRRWQMDHGKFTHQQTVDLIRQVCFALDAAHSAGIIHRDLKPQNIMKDNKSGRILVMDFGLARSLESDGMTQTGMLLGTIDYMSPEQAMGKSLDARSDLFTLGLIFYELLSNTMPYKAETAMASLLKRNQDRALPLTDLDPSIPKPLSDIVAKCLERDVALRYQSASEIIADLDAWEGKRPVSASLIAPSVVIAGRRSIPWKWIAAGALGLVLVTGGFLYKGKSGPGTATELKGPVAPQVSLAILPFHNDNNDPSMDWLGSSLAEMLSTDVGQSVHMRTVPPDRIHQIFADLRIPQNSDLDPDTLRRIAEFGNADTVVWGRYAKFGDQIRIDATLRDLKKNQISPLKIEATNEKDISVAVGKLAELIRKNLAVSADVVNELKASSFQPSTKSVPALRDYSQANELIREGKNLDAVKMLQSAVTNDPQFALAWSRLAETDLTLGFDTEAAKNSRKAMDLGQSLPTAEKYLVEATHARVMKDSAKAIQAYENLAKIFPDNSDVEYTLGSLYADNGDFDKARTQFAKILKADPKNIKALWQIGSVEYQQDNPQAALEPLNKGLSLAVQVNNPEQKALILQALGISYRLMNRPEEAIKSLEDSMEITQKLGMKRLLAASLSELAQNQITIGKPEAAMTSYNQSLQILKEIGVTKDYGDTLVNRGVLYQIRGNYDKALQDYKDALQIQRDAGDVSYQAVCLSNIGDVYFLKDDTDNSLIYYQQSLQLREKLNEPAYLAETLSSLGDVHTAMGDYDEALKNLMKALEISHKANITKSAASVSGSIGKVLMYEGRLGAAVSAMQDSVNGFRSINNKSIELADSLNSLGDTLALAGRGDESGKLLEEAGSVASELKNENIHSALLNTQGDAAFYRGDFKAARTAYEQAALAASKSKDREKILITKMNLARLAVAEGRPQAAIPELRASIQQADKLHLKYFSTRSTVDLAEALIKTKDYTHARQELETALTSSEKLGLRLEKARIQFLLGDILRLTGSPSEAAGHFQQSVNLLNDLKKESGAEKLLQRSDLKSLYEEASQAAGQAKA